MTTLLSGGPVTPEQQLENARTHRPGPVLAVLAVLALYAYLFTHVADVFDLPRPQALAENLGLHMDHVFDDDHNVDSEIRIPKTRIFNNDDERLILFAVAAAAFLCAYFLPLRRKRQALVFWFLIGLLVLYGPRATAGLVFAHWLVYLTLHPPSGRRALAYGSMPGLLAYLAFAPSSPTLVGALPGMAAWGVVAALAFRFGLRPLLEREAIAVPLRTVAVQSAIILVFAGALFEGLAGDAWALPIGILLFFWHWERLIMYHVDYKDGLVPKDVAPLAYLSVFLHPGALPNWTWGVTIGQGYAYTNNNFLSEEKNKLIMDGLRLWGIALIYLVFGDWIRYAVAGVLDDLGFSVYAGRTRRMVCDFVGGGDVDTPSVLLTTFLDLFRWLLLWGGVVHFKVGLWRICGYRIDPYFNKPWMATNLVSFWPRFTFHYREFLVRAFYYPVFFRFFKRHTRTRIVFATMASVGAANLIWGHMTEEMYYHGMRFEHFGDMFQTWPYFFLLGAGISLTELYLLQKKSRRKPWTLDARIILDVVAAYCTLQFFALLHIFMKDCRGGTQGDAWRLFLKAFGIEL